MLKAKLNQKTEILDIWLDQPLEGSILDHPELHGFLGGLDEMVLPETIGRNGSILGWRIQLSKWLEFLKTALPEKESLYHRDFITGLIETNGLELGEGLDINFHQKSFDVRERYWNYILDQGEFLRYFLNRINWYLGPKNRLTAPFPMHVDLESSSLCNMNCPMCYRDGLKETGAMDMTVFQKAVDECAENHLFSMRLSWRGETLTHPDIKEMIAYASKRIPNVSFLTNAFYIDDDMADCFIDCGVSYISVSFDGIGDMYNRIRHPATFEDSYQRLVRLKAKREKKGRRLPQIRTCTIWPAIRHDPQAYYRTMKEVSDYIVCNPYINFKGNMAVKPDFICQYPWERMVVAFNGQAQCCTGWNADDIILGNVAQKTIKEMWHSELMHRIREIHARGGRMELNSCANCRHGAEGDPDVTVEEILGRGY